MTEQVRFTKAGKAALAEISAGQLFIDETDKALLALVAAAGKRYAAAWKRGLPKADDEGKAAYELAAKSIVKGKLPTKLTAADAARLLSLFGARESDEVAPLGELIIRKHGLAFAMEVVARMWSLRSNSHNPDWPKSEKRLAAWIEAIEDDDSSVHDASCSYSKSAFTRYLARRHAAGTPADRAQMKKAVTAIWSDATPHARPALAYATDDPKRAKQSAEELIHAGESPYPHFAWDTLPYVITEPELALRVLRDNRLSVKLIKNLGTACWGLYESRLGESMDAHARARILEQFANFYGPKTALIIAEYEDTTECAATVRDYFTTYPELLDKIIDEPALKYHRDDLLKLKAPGKPVRDRPRS